MDDLLKSERLQMRLTPDQLDRIERAAAIVSRRRGELVDPSSLARELAVPGVNEILASATAEELEAAAAYVAERA
jgi:hypothetical protein